MLIKYYFTFFLTFTRTKTKINIELKEKSKLITFIHFLSTKTTKKKLACAEKKIY